MALIKKRVATLLLTILMLLAVWPVFAWGAAEYLIVRTKPESVDAIVIMSGSATFKERTEHAAQLYREGRAKKIILTNDNMASSWSEAEQRNPLYYERAKEKLIQLGIPESNIEVINDHILGTYHEACIIRVYCESHNINSIVVVTSGYHSRRALWTFRHVFEDTPIQVGMDPAEIGIDTPSPALWWTKSFGWEMVAEEYGKLLCYRLNIK